MRINGNFFNNFMGSSFFNRHSTVSGMFGRRNVGSANMPDWNRVNKYSKTYMKDGVLYHVGNKNADRNRANKYSKTYMKDGVLYHKGNRTESKLYTRQGTLAGARPNQRRQFYSGQQILDAIKKYDSYTLGYDGRSIYFQGRENVYRSNGKYAGSHPVGEKMYFNPDYVNDALGIHNPKQMSVKDNEVRFDSYSYYQFKGKDGRNHTVLSMGSSLNAGTFANFGKERIDKEAVEYADFWEDVAHGNVWSIEQRYSQKEIRQKLTDVGIQNGFFTVTVGNRSQSYYLSANEDAMTLFDKETYDKRYNALISGKTFQLDKFQPGQTVTIGGKDYVLNEHKGIDIEYGAEVY